MLLDQPFDAQAPVGLLIQHVHMLSWVEDETSGSKDGRGDGEMFEAILTPEHVVKAGNASEIIQCARDTQDASVAAWQVRE